MFAHQVIICNEDANRLAVFDVIEHHGQTWLDCCRAAGYKWLRIKGLRYLSSHVSSGDLIIHVQNT